MTRLAPGFVSLALLGLTVVMLGIGGYGGIAIGERRGFDVIEAKNAALAQAASDLRDSRDALRGAAKALREVNDEAQRRIAAAEAEKRASDQASIAALAAADDAEARLAEHRARTDRARRERPGCAALLDTYLEAVCGL